MSEKKNKKHSSKDSSSKNEESFRVQYNAIPIPTYTWKRVDKGFTLINYNDAALKITEGKIPDYVGKTAKELYADQPEILKGMERCFSEHSQVRRQIRYRFKSTGKKKYLLVSCNFAPPDLILVHTEDITKLKQVEANLHRSEERFRNLMEHIPGISVQGYNTDGKVFYWNKASEEVYGYTAKEVIGKNLADMIIPPDIEPIFKKCLEVGKKVEESGEFCPSGELMLLHKKGHLVPVYSMHTAVCIKGEKPLLYCVDVDLSERKKAEERYKMLFHSSPDGICEIDEEEVAIVSINRAMAKNFGCKPEDMIGKAFSDFLPKKLYDYRYKIGRKALDENKIQEFEDERAGRYFYNTFVPLISKDGKKYLQIISRNITSQRRTEKKYRTLFESSKDAIMMLSPPAWKFIAGNSSAFKMFNAKSEKEFTASEPWALSPEFQPDGQLSSEKAKKMIEEAMKTGSNFFEWTHKRLDGKEFPATVLLTKIELEGKRLLQATVRDITKQKKIEKSLQDARNTLEEKVKERTAELTETYEKLQESERKYRLLFDVSPVGIGIADVNGDVIDGNAAMERMTGYSIDELRSKDIGDTYMNPDDRKRLVKELQKKGRVRDWEVKLKNKDGKIYYALLNIEKIDFFNRKGYITAQRDISKQKANEQEIIQTKNRLQNVINSTSELIIAIDQNNKISTWNKTAEDVTRYKQKQVIGKNLEKLKVFDRLGELKEYLKNVYAGYTGKLDLILRARLGSKRIFRVHGSVLQGDKQHGIILVGRDVTEDSEAHGKLLLGSSYLLTDEDIKSSLDLFVGLITSEHDGLFITRASLNDIQNMFPSIDVDVVYLSQENIKGVECIYDPNTLAEKIDEFTSKHSKPAVLLDRIDYLLSNFSFGEVMNVLYKINDIIARNNAILLLRLNPLILEKQQFMLIKEELKPLPSKRVEDIELEDTLFDILTFVYGQNKQNVLVSYQKISQEFSISKVTTGKRLSILKDKNLVSIKMKGRLKSVSLTGKGDALLNRRMAV